MSSVDAALNTGGDSAVGSGDAIAGSTEFSSVA